MSMSSRMRWLRRRLRRSRVEGLEFTSRYLCSGRLTLGDGYGLEGVGQASELGL